MPVTSVFLLFPKCFQNISFSLKVGTVDYVELNLPDITNEQLLN